jgi:hypothetical protein
MSDLTFTIEADAFTLERFKKFLASLQYATVYGRSLHLGMYMDGDGADMFAVTNMDLTPYYYACGQVDALTDFICASDFGYTGKMFQKDYDYWQMIYKRQAEMLTALEEEVQQLNDELEASQSD